MANTTKKEEEKAPEPQSSEAHEGTVASTPDNEAPEYEAPKPITVSERDAVLNRPLIAPADESRVVAKSDNKEMSSEDVVKALEEEEKKKAEKAAKEDE
jgi:hypothetical protein